MPSVLEPRSSNRHHRSDAICHGVFNRRGLFNWVKNGLAGAAAASLLLQEGALVAAGGPEDQAAPFASQADDPPPHHAPVAKRVIHVVACGGVSQVDSFDYKPKLKNLHAKPLDSQERPDVFFGKVGLLRKNDWPFKQRGQSGLWVSELFPHLAEVADELTIIRSMFADTSNHTPATFQESTGFRLNGFPVLGSWLSYGLGSETEELPSYVVIPDSRGVPAGGSINWTNGFLSASHQGVVMKSRGAPIDHLHPAQPISRDVEQASRRLLAELNRRHLAQRGESDVLSARIRSYELAAKMQLAAPQVADLQLETEATHRLYGLGGVAAGGLEGVAAGGPEGQETEDFGRACLLARRLLERGVRFVQLFSGGAFGKPRINWDGHEDMIKNHGREALRIDRPLAGLLRDLRQRGMLDETLVLFTSEFGRTPFTQSDAKVLGKGRDHNQYGFSVWLAGAGLKSGLAYGATDDFGWKAVENRVHWNDFHATVLHLLGIDHERLTFYHNGIRRRLTNVAGKVIDQVLA